jgi:hypothetical protein
MSGLFYEWFCQFELVDSTVWLIIIIIIIIIISAYSFLFFFLYLFFLFAAFSDVPHVKPAQTSHPLSWH